MKISYSPYGIIDPKHPGQGVSDMKNAGLDGIFLDLAMCCSAYELEKADDPVSMTEALGVMTDGCISSGLRFSVARAPYLLRETKREDAEQLLMGLAEESIELCGRLGCRYLVVRPLTGRDSHENAWEINRNFYLSLARLAREHDVKILLENQCRSVGGHLVRGVCADPYTAVRWVDSLNRETAEERFGFAMDVGTCSICGQDMQEFSGVLGDRIKAVILRDCDGHREASMLPFTCVDGKAPATDWLGFIRGMRQISFDGQLCLDFSDTAAVFSPMIRPQLLALAGSVAAFFRWQMEIEKVLKQHDSIVLFGAGNMCRNYMKCYGESYPPLFTCDNNKSLWGTEFCGLEVRPPEALRHIPDDCCVLICNIYYREIEAQLKELGVGNIAFFNDEYMPSFHFDRISR